MVFVAGVFLKVVLCEFIGELQDLAGVAVVQFQDGGAAPGLHAHAA